MAAPVTPCPRDGTRFFQRECPAHWVNKDVCEDNKYCQFCQCCRRRLDQAESKDRGLCFYCKDHFAPIITARSAWTA